MKIYDYKLIKPFSWCLVLCMTLFVNILTAQAPELVCDDVQISVGADCTFEAAADVFTEGDASTVTTISFSTFPEVTVVPEGTDTTLACGTYTFTVTEASGNTCWGTVVVEDKLGPIDIDDSNPCPPDTPCPANCLDDLSSKAFDYVSMLLGPSGHSDHFWNDKGGIEDCSGPVEIISPTGPIVGGDRCDSDSLDYWYIYSFVDAKGMVAHDTIALRVGNLVISDLVFPAPYDGSCEDDDLSPNETGNISHPDVASTSKSIVYVDGTATLDGAGPVCNLIINYMDMKTIPACEFTIPDCGNSRKVLRMWQVIDWCTGQDTSVTQILSLKDTLAPVVTPEPDVTLSTDPWRCAVDNVEIDIDATDECATDPSVLDYTLLGPPGVLITGGTDGVFTIASAPKGVHTFYAYAADCCDNVSEPDTFTVTIIDEVKPTAIAKQYTVASLVEIPNLDGGEKAIAKVFAESIDNGSYDMCTDVYLEVRRIADDGESFYDKGQDPCDEDDNGVTDEADPSSRVAPGYLGGASHGFSPFVKFCCADVRDEGHKVELRVWDDADMNGEFGTDGDNYNVTWGYVKIEDPNPPVLETPDCQMYCHEVELSDINDLVDADDWAGLEDFLDDYADCKAKAYDLCDNDVDAVITDAHWDYYNKACNAGILKVYWRAEGAKGSFTTGSQEIKVYYKDEFSCADVNWPTAGVIEHDDCMPEGSPDLTFDAGACELIGWSKDSTVYEFETNACLKITYQYTVVDWCIYDAYKTNDRVLLDELWYHDGSTPVISGESCLGDPDNTAHHETGKYTWYYTVKVYSEEAPDIEVTSKDTFEVSADCTTPVHVTAVADAECEAVNLRWHITAEVTEGPHDGDTYEETGRGNIEYHFEDFLFHVGTKIEGTIKVWDGCGNSKEEYFYIYTVDKKPPTPYCVNLSSAYMEAMDHDNDPATDDVSMVELWAIDFDKASFDCYDELFFTFDEISMHIPTIDTDHFYAVDGNGDVQLLAKEGDDNYEAIRTDYLGGVASVYGTEIYFWDTSENSAGQVFTCDDPGIGVTVLKVTVWDGAGNYDFCTVNLTLDGHNKCGDGGSSAMIAGGIATEAGSEVSGVQVNLDGLTNPEYKLTDMTTNTGGYAFEGNPMYNAYDISAARDGDDDEGVTTLDLVMIQRHILGLSEFTSPYKVIASDINNDGNIKGSDLIVLRKLILGIFDELPSNESWRFVDASQSLSPENALIDFSEVINISDLDNSRMNEDFVAIKIGDVSGDARTNARDGRTTVRSNSTLAFTIQDRNVKAGESVDITFSSADFNEVYGYQFTLGLNGLKFEGVSAGSASMTDDNVALLDANTLTVSYADIAGLSASDNIFSITATATRDGNLGQMLNINGSEVSSQAYSGTSLEISTLELNLQGQEVTEFGLAQNEPNPFNDFTVVGFTLPQDAQATITVYDVAGKVLTLKREFYNQGYNTVRFTKNELGTSGVLYYTLESGEFTATKKMIIIE